MKTNLPFNLLTSEPVFQVLQKIGSGSNTVQSLIKQTGKTRTAVSVLLSYLMEKELVIAQRIDPKDGRKATYKIDYEKLRKLYFEWAGKKRKIPEDIKKKIAENLVFKIIFDETFEYLFLEKNDLGSIESLFYLHTIVLHQFILFLCDSKLNPKQFIKFDKDDLENAKEMHEYLLASISNIPSEFIDS